MITRSKPLERNYGVSEQGANRSKETGELRKRLENFRTRSKPLEKQLQNFTISEEGADRSNKAREFRNSLEDLKTRTKPLERKREFQNFCLKETRQISKETRKFAQNKKQPARKELKNFRSRSNLLKRD